MIRMKTFMEYFGLIATRQEEAVECEREWNNAYPDCESTRWNLFYLKKSRLAEESVFACLTFLRICEYNIVSGFYVRLGIKTKFIEFSKTKSPKVLRKFEIRRELIISASSTWTIVANYKWQVLKLFSPVESLKRLKLIVIRWPRFRQECRATNARHNSPLETCSGTRQ